VMTYCPICLNNTLTLSSRGIVHISINGLHRDTGRFLFNTSKESPEEIASNFKKKLDEFFMWYSTFQNQDPIKLLSAVTSDFVCDNGCIIPMENKSSIIGILIPEDKVMKIVNKLCEKYCMKVALKRD
jgi:hypothetical protein